MMDKFIRRSVAGAALLMASPAAHAADMIRKAPPYPVSMSPMWSGAYVGFNVGYAWGSSHATTSVADPGTYFLPASVAQIAAAGAGTVNSKGFTGGVQAGYNWQFGRVVFGIEADANALSLKGSRTASATYLIAAPAAFTITQEVKTDWLATIRPRLGYAFDSILVYGRSRGLRKNAAVERREVNAHRTGRAPQGVSMLPAPPFGAPFPSLREGAFPLVSEGMEIPAHPAPCENRGGGALTVCCVSASAV